MNTKAIAHIIHIRLLEKWDKENGKPELCDDIDYLFDAKAQAVCAIIREAIKITNEEKMLERRERLGMKR